MKQVGILALGILAILASTASAQTTCQGTTGPDVIVGAITGPSNYGSISNVEALSLGTTSCNMGTSGVAWKSNSAAHPVIGGELYRFKFTGGYGRFEQVGISWLKHGFFAESEFLCCNNCQATDGTSLGVGCSDPYTSDRNGTQSLLGPRYQVNPYTGVFTYPPPHPSGGNTGRLQLDVADCETSSPSGTRYFANSQYIAHDDAIAGHGLNNCSHREVTCSGSGTAWNFGFSGTTTREQPAIREWPNCETSVTLRDVQIPSEGFLILGYKTTALGGGLYHYEYAIYNMNSDRAAGSFSLPIPSNVQLTNVGFHDVTYRGGDGVGGVNQDGTDWGFQRSGAAATWSTTPFATNANANAIRWGTTYNFRFDADAPPTFASVTIGTFKDNGAVQTTADVPGDAPPGVPFCFGDGSVSQACPCANIGDPGSGCPNSKEAQGAVLSAAGNTSPDTVVLTAARELPTTLSVVLQGTTQNANGFLFGDGLRCTSGVLKRLYTKNASAGVVTAPEIGDLSITAASAAKGDVIPPGGTRYYQIYYRDPDVTFCAAPNGDLFNITSGLVIVW